METDKPSRLAKSTKSGLNAAKKGEGLYESGRFGITTFNIYITNDKEIENCWFVNLTNNEIGYIKNNIGTQKNAKKIILTTDIDLIKDGIQSIDEEFLEWFVKNPICEEVYVKDIRTIPALQLGSPNGHLMYEIIIPKEELKQDFPMQKLIDIMENDEELRPKQETLEEAAKKIITDMGWVWENTESAARRVAEYCAKQQQERMYSEEEVINFLQEINDYPTTFEGRIDITEWFEKFKNK